jgi:hypothetical protein
MNQFNTAHVSKTTQPDQSPSPIMQILGMASNVLGSYLSDKTMKTDIEKLGKDKDTGLDMYAYRYKGDPKSYPKVVGPMAQDIEKANPGSTGRAGGKMTVPIHMLLG